MADEETKEENVDSMETDSASEGKSESPPKRAENLCCYSQKECDLEKLKGFDFCHKHILEDNASPFKPCDFILKTNGKKCTNPAPKLPGGQKSYCLLHSRDSHMRKASDPKTKKTKRKLTGQLDEHGRPRPGPGRPPGVRNYTKRPKAIDIGGEYRRDDVLRVDSSWHGDYESDSESLDNEMDDPLRHAGVWSAEEVTKMCRDKLLRLRSLYMSQFERLKHVYKNKRRRYLLATSVNEDGLPVHSSRPRSNEPQTALHIASRSYNKRYRTDALLQKQSKEKRLGAAARDQTLPQQRCSHYIDGNRCTSKVVPFAKFCLKHICDDPNQQLFFSCSQITGADQTCSVTVPNVSNHEKCLLHLPHNTDFSVGNLEEELQHAKERQIINEKEREEKRQKAALAKAAHEAKLLEIAKAEAAQKTQALLAQKADALAAEKADALVAEKADALAGQKAEKLTDIDPSTPHAPSTTEPSSSGKFDDLQKETPKETGAPLSVNPAVRLQTKVQQSENAPTCELGQACPIGKTHVDTSERKTNISTPSTTKPAISGDIPDAVASLRCSLPEISDASEPEVISASNKSTSSEMNMGI